MATRLLQDPRPVRFAQATAGSAALSIAAVGASILIASALAYNTKLGVALMLALCFVPLALLRLQLAICAWIVLLFFSRASGLEALPDKLLLFITVAWIGLLVGRRATSRKALVPDRAVMVWVAAFVLWVSLTLAWAPALGAGERPIKELLYGGLGLALVLGATVRRRHVRWVMMAFVAGAALSVLWGAAKGGLSVSGGEVADLEGRLQGGAGDPNYLAAVLVPAVMLAAGLAVQASAARRVLLAAATAVIAVGIVATQSRGGLVAGGVCAVVALVIWRGRRGLILALIGLVVAVAVMFYVANPAAWHRVQAANGNGSGRVYIWNVAWRIVHDHTLFGVGIGQFPQVSPHYVLKPGALEYVHLIVDQHAPVHNVYLQLWVEAGIIGLLLFLGLVVTSLALGWRAARRFDARGDVEMSALSRASIIALIGILTASFFLSNLNADQLWVLLALGPVLYGLAQRQPRASPSLDAPG